MCSDFQTFSFQLFSGYCGSRQLLLRQLRGMTTFRGTAVFIVSFLPCSPCLVPMFAPPVGDAKSVCREMKALEALSYIIWIYRKALPRFLRNAPNLFPVMLYTIALIFGAFRASRRGHPNAWTADSRELPYNSTQTTAVRGDKVAVGPNPPMNQANAPVAAV